MILRASRKQIKSKPTARKSMTVKMAVVSPELANLIAMILTSVACIED
jgi:hypothetical protein